MEIAELDYYTEHVDELIEIEDCKEMKVITSRVEVIQNRISDLISKIEEMKIEQGLTSRSVRQWKMETKEKYSHMLAGMKHPALSSPRPFRAQAYFWRGGTVFLDLGGRGKKINSLCCG